MSYEPTAWANGDIITATKLNNIESGVQSVSSSYTPTTWANGDIITAVKLNNIEQGIVNAGGGSSDFSTAEVTVIFETSATLLTPYCYDSDGFAGIDVAILDSDTYTVALYKGVALASVQNGQIAGTGNIEIEGNEAIITGDCTITIS